MVKDATGAVIGLLMHYSPGMPWGNFDVYLLETGKWANLQQASGQISNCSTAWYESPDCSGTALFMTAPPDLDYVCQRQLDGTVWTLGSTMVQNVVLLSVGSPTSCGPWGPEVRAVYPGQQVSASAQYAAPLRPAYE